MPAPKVALLIVSSIYVARAHQQHGETVTSIDEMSETDASEYKRAEIAALRPILGELVAAFWQTLTDQWKREGRSRISP